MFVLLELTNYNISHSYNRNNVSRKFPMNSKENVLLITNIPTPYRIPLFNEIAKQLAEKNLHLEVLFGALGYSRRQWDIDMSNCEFSYQVLKSKSIKYKETERISFDYPGLSSIINEKKPAAIITNAFSIATTKLYFLSWIRRIPYIIWSGAVPRRGEKLSLLRILQRKMVIKRAKCFVTYGTRAKEYLVSLGAKEQKIEIGINTTDTNFFATEVEKIKSSSNSAKKSLLYIGYFTEKKRLDRLLNLVHELSKTRDDFCLTFVGDGPEREKLQRQVEQLQIQNLVQFAGFRQKEELPKYLAEAYCFLFPSEYDVWGLVLVEAMSAGVACLSSIYSGATQDLIQDGVNGYAVNFEDEDKILDIINKLLDDTELTQSMGKRAKKFIAEKVSIPISANGFVNAILKTI